MMTSSDKETIVRLENENKELKARLDEQKSAAAHWKRQAESMTQENRKLNDKLARANGHGFIG